ncbi:MAG TPA: calcium-binding protein [Thermoleophilaceae bacterium]
MPSLRLAWLPVVALSLAWGAPASAATLEHGRYVAASGEVNHLTLTYADGWFHYSDPGVAIAATGPDCELTDPAGHAGRCRAEDVRLEQDPRTGRDFIPRPSAALGDGDDAADVRVQREEATRIGVAVEGGPGADVLTVAAPMAVVDGDRGQWESAPDDGADRIAVDAGVVQRNAQNVWEQISPTAAVRGGGGADEVTVTGAYNRIWGGDGDDVLTGDDLHPPPKNESCKAFMGSQCFTEVPGQNCWGSWGVRSDEIEGGDGDDRIYGRAGEDYLFGGAGRDVVEGGGHCDTVAGDHATFGGDGLYVEGESTGGDADALDGGDEVDRMFGGPGDDRVAGGEGFDRLSGGSGADTVDGGGGVDHVRYDDRTGPVVVTLDLVADDGEAGERDRIGPDVEEIFGTTAADRIEGNLGDNLLIGNDGDDVIVGGGGSDVIAGQGGSDRIHALEGEPATPHQPLPFPVIPGFSSYYDDSVACDEDRPSTPPAPSYPVYDPGPHGEADVVVADATDGTGRAGAPFYGCEVVLHSAEPVPLDPETTTGVPVPAYCDAGLKGSLCRASAALVAPASGGSLRASRFKPPKQWQRLGKRSYRAKLGGKRKRVKVPVSRSAVRKARGGKRVKAYVAYRYAKPKTKR